MNDPAAAGDLIRQSFGLPPSPKGKADLVGMLLSNQRLYYPRSKETFPYGEGGAASAVTDEVPPVGGDHILSYLNIHIA